MKTHTNLRFFLSLFFILLGTQLSIAQSLQSPIITPITSSSSSKFINDTHKDGDTLYVAGNFDKVGYQTGILARFSFDQSKPLGGWPYIGDGTISAATSDGNGGWYVGGKFERVGFETVSNLVHILSDGSIDSAFTGTTNGWVFALALDNNILYVGGDFDTVSNQTQSYLATLDAQTGALLSWAPNLDQAVYSILVDSNHIYVGGGFDHVDDKTQEGFAKFDKLTGQPLRAPSFTYLGFPGFIGDIYQGPNQEIYLGGNYEFGGLKTGKSALISTTSDIPNEDHPIINGTVYASVPDGNGGWFIGGEFTEVGDSTIINLTHILPGGVIDTSFTPSPSGKINCLKLDGNLLYVGGEFSYISSQSRNWLARIDLSTNTLDSWAPQVNAQVKTIEFLGNEVLIGGEFDEVNGRPQKGFCRLDKVTGNIYMSRSMRYSTFSNPYVNAIGTYNGNTYLGGYFKESGFYTGSGAQFNLSSNTPTSLTPVLNNEVFDVVPDGNGGWYVGGSFDQVNTNSQNFARLIHILPSGELDTTFQHTPNNNVLSLARDGNILYLGGIFTSVAGQGRNRLAAIDLTTNTLLPWNPDANAEVAELMVEGNQVFIGGDFSQIGGQTRNNLAAVDKNTGALATWNPDLNAKVFALGYYNGQVYVGGDFTQVGGQTHSYISAIDATTGMPNAWNPGLDNRVLSLLVEGDSLYLGGSFTTISGQTRRRIASFNLLNGSVTAWDPNSYGDIRSLATDGSNIYMGGFFNSVGSQTNKNIAAVDKLTGIASTSWRPIVDAPVSVVAIDGNNLFLGGDFENVDLQELKGLVIFDHLSQQLTAFNPQVNNNSLPAIVNDIHINNGLMFFGGDFKYVQNAYRQNLAYINLNTQQLSYWTPAPDKEVFTLESDGTSVFVGGDFKTIAGQDRLKLAAFDIASNSLISNWDPAPNSFSSIHSITLDGTDLMVGGSMDHFYSLNQQGISQISPNGLRLKGWNLGAPSGLSVKGIFVKDSLLYIGGNIPNINGQFRDDLVSINLNTGQLTDWNPFNVGSIHAIAGNDSMLITSGSLGRLKGYNLHTGLIDSTWLTNAPSSASMQTIEIEGNDILVGGNMQYLGIKDRKNIYSVDLSTNTLTDFQPDVFGEIKSIDVSGQNLYMGGIIQSVNSQARKRFAKLNKITGQVLPGSYDINNQVFVVKVDSDRIFIGGNFSYVDNQTTKNIAAIDTAGNVLNWDPDVSSYVKDIHIEGDTLFIAGSLGWIANISRSGVAALDKNTGNLLNWDVGGFSGGSNLVETIFATPSKLYIGGNFTQVGGKNRERVAAIDKQTAEVLDWDPGASGVVHDIHVIDQHVFYGGNFTSAAGLPIRSFAHVNANTGISSPLQLRVTGRIYDVNVYDSLLYIGGGYGSINNISLGIGANFSFPSDAFDPVLDAVVPNVGGDNGTATINIFGAGFQNVNSVKLQKTGQADIEMPDSLLSVIDGIQIVGPVDLQGVALGLWNVSVELADGTILTLPNGFEVQAGTPADLSVDVIGFNFIRPDQWQNYIIDVKNNGLNDAKAVPLWFAATDNFEVDLSFDIQHPDSMGTLTDSFDQFIVIDSLAGTAFPGKVYSLLIPSISPNTNKIINISLKKDNIDDGQLWAWVKDPWFTDSLATDVWDCFYAKADSMAIANGNSPLSSNASCFYASAEDYYQYLISTNFFTNGSANGNQVLQEGFSSLAALGESLDSCANGIVDRDELLKQLLNTQINTSNTISTEICNPSPPLLSTDKKIIQTVQALDPNDKTGPAKWVNAGEETPYLIRFENVDSATAAAQRVLVLDTLNQNVFDLNSFELGMVTVGDQIYSIPPGQKSYSRNIDLRPAQDLILKITASLDMNTGIARWEFEALDPSTMELTLDPLVGFLPPNVTAPEGEGSVFFTINTKPNLPVNTEIKNEAHIYFDQNEVIKTDPWINIVDEIKPQSAVNKLPEWTSSSSFSVSWDGSDIGSGVEFYDVYVSTNGGDFEPWLLKTSASSEIFSGVADSTYGFYCVAIDSAGNVEDPPLFSDATTSLVSVGINDPFATEWTYHVYPNPSKGSFRVEVINPQQKQISIELFDLQGKKIEQRMVQDHKKTEHFEIGYLPEGIYLIKVQIENEIKIERLIIKK